MIKPLDFPGTYADFYQSVVKPIEDAITPEMRLMNSSSHTFGNIDGVRRCLNCEVGVWNAWKYSC